MKRKNARCFALAVLLLLSVLLCACRTGQDPMQNGATSGNETSAEPLAPTVSSTADPARTEPETEPVTEPPAPPQEIRLSFAACGDNIVYYGNVREARELGKNGTMDFSASYDRIRDIISDADISFINQENIMAASMPLSYYPCFNVPQEVGSAVIDCGFDIVNMANNHMLDKGMAGLEESIAFWRASSVFPIGDYLNEADYNALRLYEKDGVTIAFLSYTYGTNGIAPDPNSDIVVPYLSESVIRRQMAAAREAADLVMVSVHWGEENLFTPTSEQTYYANLISELGADVILGHHPHVIQPVKWIKGKGGHRTLCIYSLGNLMAEMASDYNMVGGIMTFDIVWNGNTASIESPLFIPTVFDFNASFRKNQIWLMEDYTAEQAKAHGISYYGNYTTVEKLRAYVTNTIDREFLPSFLFETTEH